MKKIRIENEDYEVDWENNLFSLYQAAILKRQGEPGDIPDLAKLVSDFRNKSCAIVRTRNKGSALLIVSSRTVSAAFSLLNKVYNAIYSKTIVRRCRS
jgi:hypothetical protein